MANADAAVARTMQERALQENIVQNRVQAENLADRNAHRCVCIVKHVQFVRSYSHIHELQYTY